MYVHPIPHKGSNNLSVTKVIVLTFMGEGGGGRGTFVPSVSTNTYCNLHLEYFDLRVRCGVAGVPSPLFEDISAPFLYPKRRRRRRR